MDITSLKALITAVYFMLAVTINGAVSAAEFSQYPFGNPSAQAEASIKLAEAKKKSAESDNGVPKSEICLKYAADDEAKIRDVLKANCKPTLPQMSKLMDNPIGNVAANVSQFDMFRLKDKRTGIEKNVGMYTNILQFPTEINNDWNIIHRAIFTVSTVPVDQDKINAIAGGDFNPGPPGDPGSGELFGAISGRTTGLGDSYYVGLFAPKEGISLDGLEGKLLWGAGFDLSFPTAQENVLGSNKWTAGPSAVVAYLGPTWKLGGLLMHFKDFAGDDTNDNGLPVSDVNLTNLQYFVYYNLSPIDAIGMSPNIIMNWEQGSGDKLTVPVGIGYQRTVEFGKLPVRIGIEYYNSIIQPDGVGWCGQRLGYSFICGSCRTFCVV